MVSHPGAGGVRPFLKLVEVQALRGAADRDLLRRFAAARDEAAFRVIAERHGPMVFGVCARLLGNRHDAEDALQATFLVFARRAGCVRNSESLASWLHGVARRVATRLRRADHRRTAREQAAAVPEQRPPADPAWSEVRAGLDEELARLPEAYRDVLVLCYLEGLTRDEAGQRLGIDAGAVKGRLERGRRLLGERLTRRGIGLSAALAGLATAPPLTAALRVGRLAADPAAASPRAAALTHDFLKGVAMSKLKFVTAGLVGAAVLAAGIGVSTAQSQPAAKAAPAEKAKKAGEAGLGKFGAEPEKDTDEAFIRRVSKDLRGTDPTPAEVHFFLASKDANRRATLVDLFVKEKADKATARAAERDTEKLVERLAEVERDYQRAAADARLREATARRDAERQRAEADAAAARAAESKRAAGQADKAAAEARYREAAELLAQQAAKQAAEQAKLREAIEAEYREVQKLKGKAADPAAPAARPAPPAPPAVPAPPKAPPGAVFPSLPKAPPAPAAPPAVAPSAPPAAGAEAARIRVRLARLAVQEKQLLVAEAEERAKRAPAADRAAAERDIQRARIEVERAELLLQEAELAQPATRPAPRTVPPSSY